MAGVIKEHLGRGKRKGMEGLCGLIRGCMKGNMRMIKRKDMDITCGTMEENIEDGGIRISSMALGFIKILRSSKLRNYR